MLARVRLRKARLASIVPSWLWVPPNDPARSRASGSTSFVSIRLVLLTWAGGLSSSWSISENR